MQVVNRLFSNLIPRLVVTDRHGNVVLDSAKTGGPDNALRQFAALLKKQATRSASWLRPKSRRGHQIYHSERSEESSGRCEAHEGSEGPSGFFAALRMTNRFGSRRALR